MSKATRSRGGIAAGALIGLCLTAASALAQDKPLSTSGQRADTLKVSVTGDVVLDYVYRSREVTAYADSVSRNGAVTPGPQPATSNPENTFEGYAAMRIGVDLSEKVGGVVEFGTRRIEDSTRGRINRLGEDGDANGILLREAHVMLNEFLNPALKAQFGISTWAFDVRGRGESFAFDPRRSQTITRNFDSITDINSEESADARLANAGFPEELLPVGATFSYAGEGWMADLVLLPGVIEGGAPNGDEALYAFNFWYMLDSMGKGSKVGVIAALSSFLTAPPGIGAASNEHARVWTLGAGGVLKFMDGALEVYGEGYFQTGKAGEDATGDVDAAGHAVQIGIEYRHVMGNPMPIWFGANFTLISGDSDDTGASPDDEANRFSAYENVNDLLILESMYYGYDWDSNYQAFKVNAGTAFSVAGGKDNLELSLIVGVTQAAEEVGDTAATMEDKLGNEVDVKIRWHLSKQASFSVMAGYLFGSEILENAMESPGGPGSNPKAEDNAYLYVMGLNLRF